MGSSCLFTRQQALKMGYLYWLRVKSSNPLHTELNFGYLKGTKFCLESKASFIDISSIASFKLFLIAWLQEYCTFSDSSWLAWSPGLGQNTSSGGLFSKNKLCSTITLFFFFKYVLYWTVLSKYMKKNRGSPCSFRRKGEFISLSSLVWGKSLKRPSHGKLKLVCVNGIKTVRKHVSIWRQQFTNVFAACFCAVHTQ